MEFGTLKNNNRSGIRIRAMLQTACAIGLMLIAASCGESPGYSFTVGGIVSGLAGSGLVLQNNGGDNLTVSTNGSFSFPHSVPDGGAYSVTVATQPGGLNQTCTVVNASGVVSGMVNNIQINCTQPPPRLAIDSSVALAASIKYSDIKTTAYTIDQTSGLLSQQNIQFAGTNPNSVTIADIGSKKIVYVANFGSASTAGSVSIYEIASGGALTPVTSIPVAAGTNPSSVTIHPTLNVAYVTNFRSDTISIFTVGANGALTDKTDVATGVNPSSIKIHPTKNIAYVTNSGSNNISVYTVNDTSGLLTVQGTPVETGTNPGPVVIDSTGAYAYVANAGSNSISVYTIETNGSLTPGSPASTGSNPIAIYKASISGGEFFYVPIFRANAIAVFKLGTDGALTAGTAVATGTNPYAMATVKITVGSTTYNYAYAVNYNSNNISCYSINDTSGALTEISGSSPVDAGTNPYAITISKTSSDVYVAHVLNAGSGDIFTYKINNTTGVLTRQVTE